VRHRDCRFSAESGADEGEMKSSPLR